MLDGKQFQLFIIFITLLVLVKIFFAYWLVRTVFLCSLKGCPLVPADAYSLNKEQSRDHNKRV